MAIFNGFFHPLPFLRGCSVRLISWYIYSLFNFFSLYFISMKNNIVWWITLTRFLLVYKQNRKHSLPLLSTSDWLNLTERFFIRICVYFQCTWKIGSIISSVQMITSFTSCLRKITALSCEMCFGSILKQGTISIARLDTGRGQVWFLSAAV